jgi:hypothetical protein
MPHVEGKKDSANKDNRKAKANRNVTFEMPAAPRDEKYAVSEQAKKVMRRALGSAFPKARAGRRRNYDGPYDANVALEVLRFRAQGMTANDIAQQPGMPSQSTLALWRTDSPEFSDLYKLAFDDWLEAQVEGTVKLADGFLDLSPYYHTGLYNAVKARQWLASRRMSDRYGERVDTGEQVILQPQEIDVTTGSQGEAADQAARDYAQEQAELRSADAARQLPATTEEETKT